MDYLTQLANTKEVVDFILEFQRRRIMFFLKLQQELL